MKTPQKCPTCEGEADENSITMHSELNQDGNGFVHLAHGREMRVQFTPQECRAHALRLLEAAEAAESDAAVFRLLEDRMEVSFEQRVAFVADLRNFRDDHYKKKPDEPED